MPPNTQERDAADKLDGIALASETNHVFGHDEALQDIARQHAAGRLHHAYLVTGPKGIGKATFAYHVAGHLMRYPDGATAPKVYEAPVENDVVQSRIARGGHPNLLTLARPYDDRTKKFKTEITVDEVRRTVGFFGTTSGEKAGRVCIVDAADELNRNAANAILKILEEPPQNTVFLVLSHSPGRLLPTIRSRCQTIRLKPLEPTVLDHILSNLGVLDDLSDNDRQTVANLAEGSVRKAILLAENKGLPLYKTMKAILDQPGPLDWTQVHKIASELAPVSANARYGLFIELTMDMIARKLHQDAQSDGGRPTAISALARWTEVWEKTQHSVALADGYNLDRKQVILSVFSNLHEAAQS